MFAMREHRIVRVISKPALIEFGQKHPDALTPLLAWYKVALKATWRSLAEVRRTFPHADFADPLTVFNIGGNKYRLSVKIEYAKQMIFIKKVETHARYSRN